MALSTFTAWTPFIFSAPRIHRAEERNRSHFQNNCEEMFVISTARRNSRLTAAHRRESAGRGAFCARTLACIYNAGDKPVQWMNINVTAIRAPMTLSI